MAVIVGYHGCEREFAAGVRAGRITLAEWRLSQNAYDWLGEGIYFWEGSRSRAEQWASERFGDDADVLQVEIELGECLNLLENTYYNDLRASYRRLRTDLRNQQMTLPRNHKKRHELDNLVINNFVDMMAERGTRFQTVRAVFEEGRRLYPGSAIRTRSHIQIAVLDFRCIRICD